MHGQRSFIALVGALGEDAMFMRRVDVARIQFLKQPNTLIPRSMALDADGVSFFVEIRVEMFDQ